MNATHADSPTIRTLLRDELDDKLEAELLLAHALGRDRTYLHTWPDQVCEETTIHRFRELVERRRRGEPIAYILGHREFWSLDLRVTPDTLIPRPETELLVELALERIPKGAKGPVADLGTGSGAVGLAIARERPDCRVTLTEHSPAALEIARQNASSHHIANIEFFPGDWWQPLTGRRFRLVVSNPPYIPECDPHLREGDLPWEPRPALAAGVDGLDAIRSILAGAETHLEPRAWILLEHGYDQGDAVRRLFRSAGLNDVATHTDLAGLDRVTLGRVP